MAGAPPQPTAGIENVLGIVGAQGYMKNLGPGARHLSKATQANYLLGLKNATARYGEGNGEEPNSGRARIHYAVTHNKKNLLRNLKKRGADLEMTLNGKTPLILAIEANKPEMVEELCKLGANINARMQNGETALHLAVLSGNFRIVNILLNCGADPTIGAGSIMTPLHIAGFNGNEQMIDLLLRRGAKNAINAKSMNLAGQQAPIHTSVVSGCVGCVKLLVQAGADLNVRTRGGQTPFRLAESEYQMWQETVADDADNPYRSESTKQYHRERLADAIKMIRYLEEVTGNLSVHLIGLIDGGSRKRKRQTRKARHQQRKGTRRV